MSDADAAPPRIHHDAWGQMVDTHALSLWEYASDLAARWQAAEASEAAFLTLADRWAEVDSVDEWLRRQAQASLELIQGATWRTARPVVVDPGEVPKPLLDVARTAIDLRIEGSATFSPIDAPPSVSEVDVVVPWRNGEPGARSNSTVSWFHRFDHPDVRLDVSLLTGDGRRLLMYAAPDVEACWVRFPDATLETELDDLGYWRVTDLPEAPMSVAVQGDFGVVTTDWVTV